MAEKYLKCPRCGHIAPDLGDIVLCDKCAIAKIDEHDRTRIYKYQMEAAK